VLAIVGCLLAVGAAVLGTLVVRALTEDPEPSSAPVAQQTTAAPAGGTQVVAAKEGLSLTLPEDWEQVPTSSAPNS
jgi:hypothetical protein